MTKEKAHTAKDGMDFLEQLATHTTVKTDITIFEFVYRNRYGLSIFKQAEILPNISQKYSQAVQDKLIDMIDGVISKAKAGQEGLIRLKMNSLTDKMLIDKLVEASQAGVQVEMIVRGICCLRGGVPGLTDNVHIISIVGRFLEHSRIYIFGDGDAARYYIASADWMTRNTLRRVEVATPILQDDVKRRIDHIFDVMWHDNVQARDQQPDGSYTRRYPGTQTPLASQNVLYDEAYRMAKGIKEQ